MQTDCISYEWAHDKIEPDKRELTNNKMKEIIFPYEGTDIKIIENIVDQAIFKVEEDKIIFKMDNRDYYAIMTTESSEIKVEYNDDEDGFLNYNLIITIKNNDLSHVNSFLRSIIANDLSHAYESSCYSIIIEKEKDHHLYGKVEKLYQLIRDRSFDNAEDLKKVLREIIDEKKPVKIIEPRRDPPIVTFDVGLPSDDGFPLDDGFPF